MQNVHTSNISRLTKPYSQRKPLLNYIRDAKLQPTALRTYQIAFQAHIQAEVDATNASVFQALLLSAAIPGTAAYCCPSVHSPAPQDSALTHFMSEC